jgi:hypothetical protein
MVLISVKTLSGPHGYSAAGRIRSIETFCGFIGNRTLELLVSSLVPQATALQRSSESHVLTVNNTFCFATIDEVFYYVASVLTTCFGPYSRPSSGEITKY